MGLVKTDGLRKGSEFVVMSPYRHYSPVDMGPRCRVGRCMTGWCHNSTGIVCQTGGRSVTGLDWTGVDWIGLEWTGLDWIGLDWTGVD
jgi:hypothetical protein